MVTDLFTDQVVAPGFAMWMNPAVQWNLSHLSCDRPGPRGTHTDL